ncbi:hypothetical protein AZA_00982 [Nitrospirillum viridazoti Y2]|nr:hypothetical protein AZA_00982 [Nitrospirillum amazonense Y2]
MVGQRAHAAADTEAEGTAGVRRHGADDGAGGAVVHDADGGAEVDEDGRVGPADADEALVDQRADRSGIKPDAGLVRGDRADVVEGVDGAGGAAGAGVGKKGVIADQNADGAAVDRTAVAQGTDGAGDKEGWTAGAPALDGAGRLIVQKAQGTADVDPEPHAGCGDEALVAKRAQAAGHLDGGGAGNEVAVVDEKGAAAEQDARMAAGQGALVQQGAQAGSADGQGIAAGGAEGAAAGDGVIGAGPGVAGDGIRDDGGVLGPGRMGRQGDTHRQQGGPGQQRLRIMPARHSQIPQPRHDLRKHGAKGTWVTLAPGPLPQSWPPRPLTPTVQPDRNVNPADTPTRKMALRTGCGGGLGDCQFHNHAVRHSFLLEFLFLTFVIKVPASTSKISTFEPKNSCARRIED